MLRGRRHECAALDALLQRIRVGESAVLVLRGEAGIGKTALLEYAAGQAGGCRLARAVGVQAEMELPYAGLHHLCAPMLDGVRALPSPQQEALEVAFGLREGSAPDRFLVALAVLSLLAETAEAQPLVCLVEDAQWLDRASAQVFAFVARRLLAERIAMVFAVREPCDPDALAGLPELRVEGLATAEARSLLESAVPGRMDARVRDRILAETRGNPLALLELPRGLTPAELAGGFGLPDARPLANRIEQTFRQRVASLPPDTQRLLLTAAAEPLGDSSLLWNAATRLGIGGDAGRPAEAADLIELGARVRFKHPLVRSAVYRGADLLDRCAVHAALAEATDPVVDPDRYAWHRAHATTTPDEAVAAEMERSADRAQRRGGLSAAAAFLERAAELTPDPARRAQRALAAAQAKLEVADAAAAEELVSAAKLGPLDALGSARLERLCAEIVFARGRGRDSPPLFLEAARRLEPLDPVLAREAYLDAMASAMFAGRLAIGPDEHAVAVAAAHRVRTEGPAEALLDALVTRFSAGYAESVEPLSAAARAFAEADGGGADRRWLWLACRMSQDLWDDELWHALATRGVQLARDTGALSLLPVMANFLAVHNVHAGDFGAAKALIDEVDSLIRATGIPPLKYAAFALAATRGDRAQVRALLDFGLPNAMARGEGSAFGLGFWLTALLYNGCGEYADALAEAQQAVEHEDVMAYGPALVELVEAAARCGRPDEAAAALERLRPRTQAAGTAWALGVEARCRALVHDDEAAYRASIEHLERSRAAVDLARSRLLFGEWLRRAKRRTEARELLRAAHLDFSRIGAEAFAERARRELLATGETARRITPDLRDVLTPQEVQVARLARDGNTNPEIGAQLFISPRTVEYHLRKVFRKLDVSTRKELREALADTVNA
ncbi:AAA family ATPase [Solirubrobacter phytolaccae]|uniref:AAA family ATPase n=1 Tax=Solirubrobacter phytolaccae TaxID=1404360 RepID=A0A9X3N9H9_9ACTN|nr:helix-turn-helix transcriptional regulator [Solirubrobacter phytolaccae]MDA0181949.1 AAA family ATPase [Solirubrobacter phytolaccae]